MIKCDKFPDLRELFNRLPDAVAILNGDENHPDIGGRVMFYSVCNGVVVRAEISGLPSDNGACRQRFFGFHIHEGAFCKGTPEDRFSTVGSHFNPYGCPHPMHSGDMPPLLGVKGNAFSVFLTDRFTVNDIIGRTVIVHSGADDFKTQPSGDAGIKIACGEIVAVKRY